MKFYFVILVFSLIAFVSCVPSEVEPLYSKYEPILIKRSIADQMIKTTQPKSITKTGKFYVYKNYIFLAEENVGYHIYDNTNISSPIDIGFIEVFNSTDISILNNVIYTNQGTDMLVLDATNIKDIQLVKRLENVSAEITPDNLVLMPKYLYKRPQNTITYSWKLIEENKNL